MDSKVDYVVNLLLKRLEKYSDKEILFNKKDIEDFVNFLISEN